MGDIKRILTRHGASMVPLFGPTEERVMSQLAAQSQEFAMPRIRGGAGVIVVAIGALILPAAARADELAVKTVPFSSGAEVSFEVVSSVRVDTDGPGTGPPEVEFDGLTQDKRFRFAVSTAALEWMPRCQCAQYYEFSFQAASGGPIHRFRVRAVPRGAFADTLEPVSFGVEIDGAHDAGVVRLPLVSGPSFQPLVHVNAAVLHDAYLRGRSTVLLTFENSLPRSDARLELPDTLPYDDKFWMAAPRFAGAGTLVDLHAEARRTLDLVVEPHPWSAAEASFLRFRSDQEHVKLPLKLTVVNPYFPARSGELLTEVRVRFRPVPLMLLCTLLAGVLLGSGARVAVSRDRWVEGTLTGLVAGLLAWLVALFMVAFNSQFKLFGFELDPWQTLPTTLLGVACGLLGIESVRPVRRLFGLDKTPAAGPPPAVPAAGGSHG